MKNVVFAIFTTVLITLFATSLAFSQATKLPIGIVDVEAVVKEMPEAIAADRELTELSNRYRDTIIERRTVLETKLQNYQKQRSMMSAANQQAEEEKLLREQQEFNEYQQAKQDEINMLRERHLDAIRPKVKDAIEAIAQEEKLSLVLAKEAAIVIWSEQRLDITFRVIDRMKRGQ